MGVVDQPISVTWRSPSPVPVHQRRMLLMPTEGCDLGHQPTAETSRVGEDMTASEPSFRHSRNRSHRADGDGRRVTEIVRLRSREERATTLARPTRAVLDEPSLVLILSNFANADAMFVASCRSLASRG